MLFDHGRHKWISKGKRRRTGLRPGHWIRIRKCRKSCERLEQRCARRFAAQLKNVGRELCARYTRNAQWHGGSNKRHRHADRSSLHHAHYRGDTNWTAGDSANVTLTSSSFTLLVSPTPVPGLRPRPVPEAWPWAWGLLLRLCSSEWQA